MHLLQMCVAYIASDLSLLFTMSISLRSFKNVLITINIKLFIFLQNINRLIFPGILNPNKIFTSTSLLIYHHLYPTLFSRFIWQWNMHRFCARFLFHCYLSKFAYWKMCAGIDNILILYDITENFDKLSKLWILIVYTDVQRHFASAVTWKWYKFN